ncbi:CotY/CotZ family spore coat protein [Bacillaceae bacterium S4-13-58]
MGCSHKGSNCVCERVREINAAQNEVAPVADNCCDVSCERSIRDMLVSPQASGPVADTVPFMLTCACDNAFAGLLPYFGWGVLNDNGCAHPFFSPFFRVKKFTDNGDCCAVLELLIPDICEEGEAPFSGFDNFIRTGACFEVDLSNFAGITCFPPVAAETMNGTAGLTAGLEAIQSLRDNAGSLQALMNQ